MSEAPALVIVTTSFPLQHDGSEAAGSFVYDLVISLSEYHPIRVVAPGRSDGRERQGMKVEVYRFAAPEALSRLSLRRPVDAFRILRTLVRGRRATVKAVRDGATLHVLALWALPSGWWASAASRPLRVPYSVWTLGSDIWTLGRLPVVRSVLGRVLRGAKICFSDGLALSADTSRLAGRQVLFLPSTRRMDVSRAEPVRGEPPYRLLFIGRWHVNKGIDLLLEALNLLRDEDWSVIETVTICGGGPLEPLVAGSVRSLQRNGRQVVLKGYLDKDAAESAFLEADYLLLPSRIESIPVIFSDAAKCSLPIVAMPVGDLPELHRRAEFGPIADACSAEAYAEALTRALRVTPRSFLAGIRRHAQAFDLDSIARDLSKTLVDGQSASG